MRISLMHETHISNIIKPFQTQAIWAICQVQRPSWNDCWTLSNPRSGRMPPPKTCQDLPALVMTRWAGSSRFQGLDIWTSDWCFGFPWLLGWRHLRKWMLLNVIECYWMLYGCYMAVKWLLWVLHKDSSYIPDISIISIISDISRCGIFGHIFQSLSESFRVFQVMCRLQRDGMHAWGRSGLRLFLWPSWLIDVHCPSLPIIVRYYGYDMLWHITNPKPSFECSCVHFDVSLPILPGAI